MRRNVTVLAALALAMGFGLAAPALRAGDPDEWRVVHLRSRRDEPTRPLFWALDKARTPYTVSIDPSLITTETMVPDGRGGMKTSWQTALDPYLGRQVVLQGEFIKRYGEASSAGVHHMREWERAPETRNVAVRRPGGSDRFKVVVMESDVTDWFCTTNTQDLAGGYCGQYVDLTGIWEIRADRNWVSVQSARPSRLAYPPATVKYLRVANAGLLEEWAGSMWTRWNVKEGFQLLSEHVGAWVSVTGRFELVRPPHSGNSSSFGDVWVTGVEVAQDDGGSDDGGGGGGDGDGGRDRDPQAR